MLILKPRVERLKRYVWSTELTALRRWQARALWTLRFVYVLLRDLTRDRISLRATSLVYITLLSLVPILAVSVSVLKSIGIHRQFEPILMDFFKPLGDKGHELGLQIITFVNNLEVGVSSNTRRA